jgi:membrane fusion protein, multidrug efflux system
MTIGSSKVTSMPTSLRIPAAAGLLLLLAAAAGCGQAAETTTSAATPETAAVQLAPENVATARIASISSGPAISGQLTPAREATIRAEVGGSIVALTADRGQPVRQGAVVARISSRDLDAALRSAGTAVASSETALSIARTELARTESLVKGGALAARDLEQARNAVSSAEAAVASARARETSVSQQMDDTSVRAPFDGIVSARPASLGDVVTPGTAIVTIIDPSSLRLDALVPSEAISQIRPGAPVRFRIRGFPDETFVGKVERLSPTADPVTRQVAVFVSLPNASRRLIAGLFAEGRIETATHTGIVIPLGAVDETGAAPMVTRVRDGKAERVQVELGVRQADTEQVEVTKGVAEGDVLIVGSAKGVAVGTPVSVIKSS